MCNSQASPKLSSKGCFQAWALVTSAVPSAPIFFLSTCVYYGDIDHQACSGYVTFVSLIHFIFVDKKLRDGLLVLRETASLGGVGTSAQCLGRSDCWSKSSWMKCSNY